jgi:hypothetical protein
VAKATGVSINLPPVHYVQAVAEVQVAQPDGHAVQAPEATKYPSLQVAHYDISDVEQVLQFETPHLLEHVFVDTLI